MNKVYKFFNYNWISIIRNNIKNNDVISINVNEINELSSYVFKKEICSLVFVLLNFLITYISSIEIYKSNYTNLIFFRIFKDNFFISLFWFVFLSILPFLTLLMIEKRIKSKHYMLLCICYLLSNVFNILLLIYFIIAFMTIRLLGVFGFINIVVTILLNSNIIIMINENYLKK